MPMDLDCPYLSYDQASGETNLHDTAHTEFLGTGYSGRGVYRNRPSADHIKGFGPIPKGWYTLAGPYDNYVNSEGHHLGNCVFRLVPDKGTEMYDRTGIDLHGDNKTHDASEGCIVLGPAIREHIAALFKQGVHKLKVI